jgi:hypothetical protein
MTDKVECMIIYSDSQAMGLLISNALFMVIYLIVIGFTFYNIIVFLKGQGRWKTYTVSMFYLFTIVTLGCRMAEYSFGTIYFTRMLNNNLYLDPNYPDKTSLLYYKNQLINNYGPDNLISIRFAACQVIADYLKIGLGFFPVASMTELGLRL